AKREWGKPPHEGLGALSVGELNSPRVAPLHRSPARWEPPHEGAASPRPRCIAILTCVKLPKIPLLPAPCSLFPVPCSLFPVRYFNS
ncbi:hypothetical protein, partial [Moorena sp. SIO3I8]